MKLFRCVCHPSNCQFNFGPKQTGITRQRGILRRFLPTQICYSHCRHETNTNNKRQCQIEYPAFVAIDYRFCIYCICLASSNYLLDHYQSHHQDLSSHLSIMSAFTETAMVKKLLELNASQQSIQTVSLWLIHHRKHYANIVRSWYRELIKGKSRYMSQLCRYIRLRPAISW